MGEDKKAELQARIAKAQAAKAQVVADGAEFREIQALEAQAEAAERAAQEEAAILEAEQRHGRQGTHIAVVGTPAGVVILKRPDRIKYRHYCDEEKTTTESTELMVRHCVVYPGLPAFDKVMQDYPGALAQLSAAVGRLAGVQLSEIQGKV